MTVALGIIVALALVTVGMILAGIHNSRAPRVMPVRVRRDDRFRRR